MRRPIYIEVVTTQGAIVGRILAGYEDEDVNEGESFELPPVDHPRWQTDPRLRRLLNDKGEIVMK